ncbi:hypothetical protein C1646_753819 [Rhizophagus diaphanus]|nr:hypothetical protein C1646_753819 [Rhizophagus diaphanus] [Rhizophagus sp. MUCL 43196]
MLEAEDLQKNEQPSHETKKVIMIFQDNSKIFSDLPELTYDIIKYFKNDFSTLHSCILVNRLWCRLAIPLLWENPFSIPNKNYNFIIIYLHNLNDDLKAQLSQLLPIKLEYLSLTLIIKYENDFEMFLKNSQNTFIKKLLINNRESQDKEFRDTHDFILSYIKNIL